MQERECNTCGVKLDGYNNYRSCRTKCKECTKKAVRANRASNIEYYREFDRKRYHESDERKASARACADRARADGRTAQYKKKYRENNPEKIKARTAVSNALRDGLLEKFPCVTCGETKSEGHHEDYTRPLEVVWMCRSCHCAYHAEKGDMRAPLEQST